MAQSPDMTPSRSRNSITPSSGRDRSSGPNRRISRTIASLSAKAIPVNTWMPSALARAISRSIMAVPKPRLCQLSTRAIANSAVDVGAFLAGAG